MFVRIKDIKLPLGAGEDELRAACAGQLGLFEGNIKEVKLRRRSLDARGKPVYVCTVDAYLAQGCRPRLPRGAELLKEEKKYTVRDCRGLPQSARPVVVGFGPAGMFCALVLAEAGLRPIVLERGCDAKTRAVKVRRFFETGELDTESNVQFGEGGAGTFSDGKLNTLLKDKNFRGRYVLERFVESGAPQEILCENKPHIGTDRLVDCVTGIRKKIISLGGEVRFGSKLSGIGIDGGKLCGIRYETADSVSSLETDTVFLGIGHSARDSFAMLRGAGVEMERKVFSVGVRIEHKQSFIDRLQYSEASEEDRALLPPADYKIVSHCSTGKALYSFCMCPGGTVSAAASEEGGVVTNGMSNRARDGELADSALLVNVEPDELPGDDVFAGMEFQRELERKAFRLGGGDYRAPAQLARDFIAGRESTAADGVVPSYPRGVRFCDLHGLFPDIINRTIEEGLADFDRRFRGFADCGAVLTAPESRSTCPVRIPRGADMQSSVPGLYPIGEGAGYAGGIMSAAMDGMRAAEAYIEDLFARAAKKKGGFSGHV